MRPAQFHMLGNAYQDLLTALFKRRSVAEIILYLAARRGPFQSIGFVLSLLDRTTRNDRPDYRYVSTYHPTHDSAGLFPYTLNTWHQIDEITKLTEKLPGSLNRCFQFQLFCVRGFYPKHSFSRYPCSNILMRGLAALLHPTNHQS